MPAPLTRMSSPPSASVVRVDEHVGRLARADVHRDRRRAAAAAPDCFGGAFQFVGAARGERDVGAGLGERQRDTQAQAAAAAGDERDAPIEAERRHFEVGIRRTGSRHTE